MEIRKKFLAYTQLAAMLIVAGFFGFFVGFFSREYALQQQRPPVSVGDFSDAISLLRLQSIENGVAIGTLEGEEMRLVLGEAEEVVSLFPGNIEIPLVEILPNLSQVPAPEGMAFVASKSGKYYYPLDAPEAALITPKNRIFFVGSEEAEQAGYQPKK